MTTRRTTRRTRRAASALAACLTAAALGPVLAAGLQGCAASDTTTTTTEQRSRSASEPAVLVDSPTLGVVTVTKGVRIVHDDWAEVGYRWEWSTDPLPRGRDSIALVDILGDRVAVTSEKSYTTVLETSTGNILWQARTASELTAFVDTFRAGDVLVSCGRPELFLSEINSGNLIARQPVTTVLSTPAAVVGGHAIFGTPTGRVLAHRFGDSSGRPLPPPLDTGAQAWAYGLDAAIESAPTLVAGTVGVVSQAGEVLFVDPLSGSSTGRARISGGMATDPVTDGALMYVASLDQSIYAFDPTGTTWVWRERTASPLTDQPACFGETLYVHIPGEGLAAFNVSQAARLGGLFGQRRWTNPDAAGRVVTVREHDVVVWDGRSLAVLDRESGDTITSVRLPRIADVIASDLDDGDLYAIADNGLIVKFGAR